MKVPVRQMDDSESAHSTGAAAPPDPNPAQGALPQIETDVLFQSQAWHDVGLDAALIQSAAAAAVRAAELTESGPCELTILLTSDANVHNLNSKWRGQHRPTNVLSFPLDAEAAQIGDIRMLGDVVLAFETVSREARDSGLPLGDHVAHLVVHGVLHLLGYGHENDAAARVMENLEVRVLDGLGISNPYARDRDLVGEDA